MGKKAKVGKQRKDNYYKLAKQKGFRSRAAFKLIQLNRKFQFLENSRVCIDLCAAPGGWLQVASEYMPVSSVIVGVDLVPIDPIRNVITFQGDITTQECSEQIERTITTWKADVVLHDGAPNIGKNWLHDAYNQNLLVVSALKLACSHLQKGGWFITKIFRSMDYNSLLWVFGKLFGKVHATKPPASRSESAEIFVVCQNFKAPSKIDPRFFEPSSLFADTSDFDEVLKKQKADLMKPLNKIKKTKAVGYEGGDVLRTVTDVQFVASSSHMDHLAQCHEIKLSNQDVLSHEATTEEIKECCKDLKVLGRRELLKLLKWRRSLRKDLTSKLMSALKEGTYNENNEEGIEDNLDQFTIKSDDDDDDIEAGPELQLDDIELQENEEMRRQVRRLKKRDEKRQKDYEQRVKYGMVNSGDVLIEEENDLFNLRTITGKKDFEKIDDADPDEVLDEQPDPSDIADQKSQQKKKVRFSRTADVQYFEMDKDYESDEDQNSVDGPETPKQLEPKIRAPNNIVNGSDPLKKLGVNSNRGGGLLLDLMDLNQSKKMAASKFFDQDRFDIDLERELETDLLDKVIGQRPDSDEADESKSSGLDLSRFDDESSDDAEPDLDDKDDDDDDLDIDAEARPKRKQAKLDPEGLALASLMISSKKARKDIEDEGWNRFSHADMNAPKWFKEDEAKHCRRNIPVSQELVKEYKQKLREIDAKPIKKVLQAKARQKRRAMRKMEKVKKKVDAITSNEDMTQREKINQIKNVYKSATKLKKKEVKMVVGKKGLPTKKPGKGKYKMVDSRMKKDLRAKQRREGKKNAKSSGKKMRKKGKRGNNSLDSSSKGPRKMKSKKGTKSRRK